VLVVTIYVIGYDLHPTKGETYDELIAAIKALGSWWHCLDSTWLIISNLSAVQIRDALWPHMKADDQPLAVAYAPPNSAWRGFTGDCETWLKKNM
jgi:hypothetical protein